MFPRKSRYAVIVAEDGSVLLPLSDTFPVCESQENRSGILCLHNPGSYHQCSYSMSWFWYATHLNLSQSYGNATYCSVLLLILRMLTLSKAAEQAGRAAQSQPSAKYLQLRICQSHKSYVLKCFPLPNPVNVSHCVIFCPDKHLQEIVKMELI